MLRHVIIFSLICVSFIFLSVHIQAQTRIDLEKRKQNLQAEINQLQTQLNTTSKNKTTTKLQVETLKKQIAKREDLINAYNDELNQLTKDIIGNEQVQNALESKLNKNKKTYAALVRFNYLHIHDANPPLYLVNKNNMQAAILQNLYSQRVYSFETNKIETISKQRLVLGYVVQSLKQQHDAKMQFVNEQKQQKQQLSLDKQLHDKKYKELEATEKTLRTNLLTKKVAASKLNKQIDAIIRKEIETARIKAKAEALSKTKTLKTVTKPTSEKKSDEEHTKITTPAITSEMSKLANSFETNKGRFIWPASGSIVETFGTHPHPEVKDIVINNNGIDISLATGSSVATIYEGNVVAVFANAGYQNAVLVQHGDYYTVYANLATVSVTRGDKVKTHQVLGSIYTQPDTHKSILHFEIWKGTTKLNPQLWLSR